MAKVNISSPHQRERKALADRFALKKRKRAKKQKVRRYQKNWDDVGVEA